MADNYTTSLETGGPAFASDDISSVHHPRVKVEWGADGTANDTDTTAPLPIQVRSSGGTELATAGDPLRTDPTGTTTQPVSGTVTADAGTGLGSLAVVGGGLEATALRVTVASDSTGVLTVDGTVTANAGTGTFTVDGSGVTQPISAASLPLPTGAATSGNQVTGNASLGNIEAGYATEGAALGLGVLLQGDDGTDRKNVNVDATTGDVQVDVTNTVTVDGSGVTQPVSGTITANAGTGTFTVDGSGVTQPVSAASLPLPTGAATAALQTTGNTDLSTLAGAVAGTEMQVDIVSGNVTNAGTFAVQEDGAALTALQLIDDIVYTDDTDTHATGTSKGALVMAAATPTDGTVAANDIGAVAMSTDRRLLVDAQIAGQDATLTVDGSGSTQPISGTVTADAGTGFASLAVVGGGLEATALRVTLASDSTGLLSVDDNGGSLTVDSADLSTIAGAVTGTEMQVDVVAALPAGTNNIGDVDVATIAAGNNRIGATRIASGAVDNDDGTGGLVVKTAFASSSTDGADIVTAIASTQIRVLQYSLQADTSNGAVVTVHLEDTAGTQFTQEWDFDAREGAVCVAPAGAFLFETASGNGVQFGLSAAQEVHAHVVYVEVT